MHEEVPEIQFGCPAETPDLSHRDLHGNQVKSRIGAAVGQDRTVTVVGFGGAPRGLMTGVPGQVRTIARVRVQVVQEFSACKISTSGLNE